MKKIKRRRVIIFFVAFILTFSVWLYWGNTSIQTTYIDISSEKITVGFDGFVIAQVSDLHNAEFGNHQDRLLNAVKEVSPDVIAVTGDLIDSSRTDLAKAMEFINGAVKIAPVYFVTGNHEAWTVEYTKLEQQMMEAGVIILDDESITIKSKEDSIHLLGLKDPDFVGISEPYERTAMIDTNLKSMVSKNNEYTILLSHRPELFDVYAANNVDLVLSGHAHGGQVQLPFVGGLVAPDQGFFPKYSKGVYEEKETKMVVSRGLGNSIIPLRVNNRPELVIVTLKTSNN